MPRCAPHRPRAERGQAGLFVVVNLTVLFAVLGLAVDVGWAYYKRHAAQAAADAAGLSASVWAGKNGMACGVGGLVCGTTTTCAYPNVTPPTNALQEACMYAEMNGFTNHGTQTVSALANTTAPPGVTGNSPVFWVQVNVAESPFTLFGNFARVSAFNIRSQATAGINAVPSPYDIYIMDSGNTSGALALSGSSTLNITGGGVYVNSTSSTSVTISGSSFLTATTLKTRGNVSITGSSAVNSPTVTTTSAAAVTDPMASVNMPAYGSCDYINYSIGNSNTATLSPGVYCGGINIGGAAIVSLNAGNYILNGGGLNVGNSGRISGTGVTFFNTGSASYAAAPIIGTGSAILTLTAPTSGTYRGLLFYQDRNAIGTYAAANSFGNSAVPTLVGTLYFPTTTLTLAGATAVNTTTSIVAKRLSISGSSSYTNDTNGTKSALTGMSSAVIN